MNKILNLIKLSRPLNTIVAGSAMVISSAILSKLHDSTVVITTVLVVMAYTAGANYLNDAIDVSTDLVNRPDRPIPRGIVTQNSAITISFLLFLFGTILALRLNSKAIVIGVIIGMPLMVVYSTHLKSKPLIGNFVVAIVIGLSFLFCGTAHHKIESMWLPAMLSFALTFLRELVKDIADLKGDLSDGLATFPIMAGVHRSIQLVMFLCLLIGLIAMWPFFNGIYGFWYGIIVFIGVEIPLVIVVGLFLNNPGIVSAKQSSKILKFSSLMGLIAIYAGS